MNQKFIITKTEDNKIVFKELSELEPGIFQVMFSREFEEGSLSVEMTDEKLIETFRSFSFFPPIKAAKMIAEHMRAFLGSDEEKIEIPFNDKDLIAKEEEEEVVEEAPADADVDVDDLLKDDESSDKDEEESKDSKDTNKDKKDSKDTKKESKGKKDKKDEK